MILSKMASSVDPDEMAHNKPLPLELHCLHTFCIGLQG